MVTRAYYAELRAWVGKFPITLPTPSRNDSRSGTTESRSNRLLHSSIGNVPPAEAEGRYYESREDVRVVEIQ